MTSMVFFVKFKLTKYIFFHIFIKSLLTYSIKESRISFIKSIIKECFPTNNKKFPCIIRKCNNSIWIYSIVSVFVLTFTLVHKWSLLFKYFWKTKFRQLIILIIFLLICLNRFQMSLKSRSINPSVRFLFILYHIIFNLRY